MNDMFLGGIGLPSSGDVASDARMAAPGACLSPMIALITVLSRF